MPFKIVRNDITKMKVDVIVNTANAAPIYSDGVDTAVYKAAGEELLLAERKRIGWLKEGDVVMTPGFNLPAKHIIHAVSPLYRGGKAEEEKKLRECYKKSLMLAYENKCESIAFPLIATGSFGYPKEEGMRIAVDEINSFLLKYSMQIFLVVFDTTSTKLGLNLYPDLKAYIDHNYVCDKREEEYGDRFFGSIRKEDPGYNEYRMDRIFLEEKLKPIPMECESEDMSFGETEIDACKAMAPVCKAKAVSKEDYYDFLEESEKALKERMEHMSDTFQEYLMYLIKVKKLTNAAVYKRALVTKQLFSKIKLNPKYQPNKATALRLCVGARLNLDETKDLLARAGYALSPCDKTDIIFSFFIEHEVFDMIEISIALEEHGLPCFIE